MKHICAQPIMKFYHRKYMLQKKITSIGFLFNPSTVSPPMAGKQSVVRSLEVESSIPLIIQLLIHHLYWAPLQPKHCLSLIAGHPSGAAIPANVRVKLIVAHSV